MYRIMKLIKANDAEMLKAAHKMDSEGVENCMGRHQFYEMLYTSIRYGGVTKDAVMNIWDEGLANGNYVKMSADQYRGWEDAFEICKAIAQIFGENNYD